MMFKNLSKPFLFIVLAIVLVSFSAGCVYFNTFYNAKRSFNSAEKARKNSRLKTGRGGEGQYKKAIEKSLKVIENYPNSKYYDDALYVLGVSYFHTRKYSQSERRFRELLANYPESNYIREANLYLAKSKLMQNDMSDAMGLFTVLLGEDYDNETRTEAAMALGDFHYENKDYKEALPYFQFTRDSVGSDEDIIIAQTFIADGYYEMSYFKDALGAYLQLLGLEPDKDQKYHSLFRAADCSFYIQRIDDGQDYLKQLIDDPLYYDSLGRLNLAVARGYEADDNTDAAQILYMEIIESGTQSLAAAEASYALGLIYQYDYDSLTKAKEYYDNTLKMSRSSNVGREALQKSSDIGKLDVYARTLEIDSTTTQVQIDEAAHTQYLLAELYWFKLNSPDSGITEMRYLIDSFPSAYDVPKAMIALSQMQREHNDDSVGADSILNQIIENHHQSDYVNEAIELLGIQGSSADTGYAYNYLKKAEDFIDQDEIDSAKASYQYIVDNFPDSRYFLQAKFATIWLVEMYQSPGDSSLIFAYNEFVDSFPGNPWATEAKKRVSYKPKKRVVEQEQEQEDEKAGEAADSILADQGQETDPDQDDSEYIDPLGGIYISLDGDSIKNMHTLVKPIRFKEEFEFPLEAYRVEWPGYDFYFQLLLDFSGTVEDLRLMNPTNIEELNIRVTRYVEGISFDVVSMPLEDQGKWQVFKYKVIKPRELR